MTEQTDQVLENKMAFNGNVIRVISTVVAANLGAGVQTITFTGATPPASDETLTEPYDEDEEFLAQLKEYHGRRFSDEW